MAGLLHNEADIPVWAHPQGGARGPSVSPIYRTAPAAALDALRRHIGPALADAGDEDLVRAGIAELLARGNGARVQRELLRSEGSLAAVVRECARITASGASGAQLSGRANSASGDLFGCGPGPLC